MATTQMNIRIDETTKANGDAVFAKLGYSPTQVVRTVWEYAAKSRFEPDAVAAMLLEAERAINASQGEVRERRIQAVEAGLEICPRFLESMGIEDVKPFEADGLTAADRRERMAWERAVEKGWVVE